MSPSPYDILAPRAAALIDTITRELRSSDSPHYGALGREQLAARCTHTVEAFLEATTGEPLAFVRYIEGLDEERIDEGYYLEEVQRLLNALRDHAWELVAAHSPPARLAADLGVVCRTLGAAKDRLARVYLERARTVHTRAELLERRLRAFAPVGEHDEE
jgi:hypothetical protein